MWKRCLTGRRLKQSESALHQIYIRNRTRPRYLFLIYSRGDSVEVPFMPARVILQDFTGVPAVVDFAAMRDAVQVFRENLENSHKSLYFRL